MEYIIDKEGKKRKAIKVICEYCSKEFLKIERFLKRSNHNYCCKECFHNATRQRKEVTCSFCGKIFSLKLSNLKKSKSGLYFCCRKCKDNAQKIENNIKEIQPSHYNNGLGKCSDVYQRICFEHHPHKCCVCDEENIVAVHHYDGNHFNNEPSNLVPLCPTHHQYIHSKYKNIIIDIVDKYVEDYKKKMGDGTA